MKGFKFLLAVGLIGILFTYSGCSKKSDPTPSAQDQQLTKLSKTWKCKSVTLDNSPPIVPAGYNYTSMTLTVTGTAGNTTFGYTTAGRPTGTKTSPWAASGTFTFGTVTDHTSFATLVTRDDGLPITYSVNDTQLQLTFNYTGAGFDGRVNQVAGNWVYVFGL